MPERSRDVRPSVECRADCLRAVESFAFSAGHNRREFIGGEAYGDDLCGRRAPWRTTPAGTELIDVVSDLGLGSPFVDLGFLNLAALNDALHTLIVIRKALSVESPAGPGLDGEGGCALSRPAQSTEHRAITSRTSTRVADTPFCHVPCIGSVAKSTNEEEPWHP